MTGVKPAELESARVARILRDDILLGRRQPGSPAWSSATSPRR
ncbi:hypothetical protein [Microbacterium sp. EF45047]|nr:hypothetical protein [Microbacterium sp. EF45047]